MESKLEQFIINANDNVLDALNKINNNGKGIVFVCNEEKVLYGTVTDGDIRRHLIHGGEINVCVVNVMNKTPYVIHSKKEDSINYTEIMREKIITAIPIIDNNGKLIDAISVYDDKTEIEKIDLPVVIMAGGKGTRLQPYTNILPKPLIPIGNKTITERIMDIFIENGCTRFNMIVNYKKEYIETYFKEANKKYSINFVEETGYKGTGGGLSLLKGQIKERFIMTNCDVLIEDFYSKYLEMHKKQENLVTIIGAKKQLQLTYGIMHINEEGTILKMEEKPQYSFLTNTGFYIIEPKFLEMVPDNEFVHMPDLIVRCIEYGYKIGTFQIPEERWHDMGQIDELNKMRQKFEIGIYK